MGKYFTIEELSKSDVAKANGIDNTPSKDVIKNMERLIELLDKIRIAYDAPIKVNSGYRCLALNRRVGGVPNSDHIRGQAADLTTGMYGSNRVLFDLIRTMPNLIFHQLIDEKNYSWIHISIRDLHNLKQVLHK